MEETLLTNEMLKKEKQRSYSLGVYFGVLIGFLMGVALPFFVQYVS